jgi:lysozyme family protein
LVKLDKYYKKQMDYIDLYNRIIISPGIAQEVNIIATGIRKEPRYLKVEEETGVNASLVGAIHQLESDRNFLTHLHNGDSLLRKTRKAPAGRPPGKPPFTWLNSAIDAVKYDDLTTSDSKAEQCQSSIVYNGLGYERKGIVSPYGFSGSQFYTRGKYTGDGVFNASTVSKQVGVCVILKEIERLEKLELAFPPEKVAVPAQAKDKTTVISNRVGVTNYPGYSIDSRGVRIVEAPPKTDPTPVSVPLPELNKLNSVNPIKTSTSGFKTVWKHPVSSAKLSTYFTVGEFTRGNTRKFTSEGQYEKCKALAFALDDVREFYGKPITITSGLRTPAQNKAAGGVPNSQHLSTNGSCAADLIVKGISNYQVFDDYNGTWVNGLGRYSNGTTHFDLRGYSARWDWSGRAGLPKTEEEAIALFKKIEKEGGIYTQLFPAYLNTKANYNTKANEKLTDIFDKTKQSHNNYIGDVIANYHS